MLFAGSTVVIALLSLYFGGIPIVRALGYSAAIVVAVAVVAALTLLPGVLGLLGERINSLKLPFGGHAHDDQPHGWAAGRAASAATPGRRRSPALVDPDRAGAAAARHHARPARQRPATRPTPRRSSPTTSSREGFGAGHERAAARLGQARPARRSPTRRSSTRSRQQQQQQQQQAQEQYQQQAQAAAAAGEPPPPEPAGPDAGPAAGAAAAGEVPQVGRERPAADQARATRSRRTPTSIDVSLPAVSKRRDRRRHQRRPRTPRPSSERTRRPRQPPPRRRRSRRRSRTRRRRRPTSAASTAAYIDLADRIGEKLPLVIAIVLALSFLLLMLAFRSLLVPLTAGLMNLVSVAASYGVLVAGLREGLRDLADRPRPHDRRSSPSCRC